MIRLLILTLTYVINCACHSVFAGEFDPQQSDWYPHYSKQPNAPKPEEMLLNTDVEPDLTKGFKSLFNGKNLEGWTSKGGSCTFEVRDGLLVGKCVPGSNSTYPLHERS